MITLIRRMALMMVVLEGSKSILDDGLGVGLRLGGFGGGLSGLLLRFGFFTRLLSFFIGFFLGLACQL